MAISATLFHMATRFFAEFVGFSFLLGSEHGIAFFLEGFHEFTAFFATLFDGQAFVVANSFQRRALFLTDGFHLLLLLLGETELLGRVLFHLFTPFGGGRAAARTVWAFLCGNIRNDQSRSKEPGENDNFCRLFHVSIRLEFEVGSIV